MPIIPNYPISSRQPTERTCGTVWSENLAETETPPRELITRAHFSPGARTCWHQHPLGQILLIEAGVALVQERGAPIREVRAGGTVICPPGTWHWHGAAPTHIATQLAVTNANDAGEYAVWGENVTDLEYQQYRDSGSDVYQVGARLPE